MKRKNRSEEREHREEHHVHEALVSEEKPLSSFDARLDGGGVAFHDEVSDSAGVGHHELAPVHLTDVLETKIVSVFRVVMSNKTSSKNGPPYESAAECRRSNARLSSELVIFFKKS